MDQQTVLDVFGFQRHYLSLLVDDIPDEQMTTQPTGFPNHPAWQLGHLTVVMDNITGMIGGKKTLDESWSGKFGMGSKPVADRKNYPSKAELMRTFDERRAALTEQYKRAPAHLLSGPNPIQRAAAKLPTIGKMVCFLMLSHEATHLGQLSAWRKAVGMPEALSKLS